MQGDIRHGGECVSLLLDLSAGIKSYIEECEVRCNPVEISCLAEEGALVSFQPVVP